MNNFSIYESLKPTNENLIITFTPDSNIVSYTYRTYRDDELISVMKISNNDISEITLDSTGNFKIKVEAFDGENTIFYESGNYIIDKTSPELKVGESIINMRVKDTLNVMGGVKAKDNLDGDITKKIVSNIDELDLNSVGRQKLVYTVSDEAGNTTSKIVTINITKNNTNTLVIVQISIVIILLILLNMASRYLHSLILEKRFAKYVVEPSEDETLSILDIIVKSYLKVVRALGYVISKTTLLSKYSKRFNKYLLFTKERYRGPSDIVASKFMCAIAFLIIAIISNTIQNKTLNAYEMVIPLVLGFFVLDVIYLFRYRFYRDRIENDLLQGVIVMNNAFKSGRSIVQAIDLVGKELPGIIGGQFVIMKKELAKGLDVDVVFSRFADRINIEEVNYLTASLTILNRTGGNIIKVFDTIQNSLFMKKKLRLELRTLTSSSKVIMWVLFLVPVLYILIITVLNPTYFEPFFNTSIGIVLATVAGIFYMVYIFVVRKILKVRM